MQQGAVRHARNSVHFTTHALSYYLVLQRAHTSNSPDNTLTPISVIVLRRAVPGSQKRGRPSRTDISSLHFFRGYTGIPKTVKANLRGVHYLVIFFRRCAGSQNPQGRPSRMATRYTWLSKMGKVNLRGNKKSTVAAKPILMAKSTENKNKEQIPVHLQ